MDYSSRKAGTGSAQIVSSKESLRTVAEDSSKSGRVATTLPRRPSKEHLQDRKVKRSHDHVKSSSSTTKEPQRISSGSNSSRDHVKLIQDGVTSSQLKPKVNVPPHRNHASVESVVTPHRLKDSDREREIPRSKPTGGGDSKMVQRVGGDFRERDHVLNRSLKRNLEDRDEGNSKFVVQQRPKGEERDQRHRAVDESKGRLLKPKSTATRPDASKELHRDNVERRPSNATNSSPRVTEVLGVVKKEKLLSDRNGAMKAEDGKDVRVQRSVAKIEPGRGVPREPVRSVKMVTGTVVKAKQEKLKRKVFSLPGQRFEPPDERDALRLFYSSLHRQLPTSDMASIWLMEHGLLEAEEAQRVLTYKVKSKTGVVSKGAPFQAPTPPNFRNGSSSAARKSAKFRTEDFLDVKPVSKKLKL